MPSPSPSSTDGEGDDSHDITGSDIDPNGASINGSAMVIDEVPETAVIAPHVNDEAAGVVIHQVVLDSLGHGHLNQHEVSDTEDSVIVPYFETIDDLGRKEEGCLYRLAPKIFIQCQPHYNPYEIVPFLEDRVVYKAGSYLQSLTDNGVDWIVREISLSHREFAVTGYYHLLYHQSWANMQSQGRAHCFKRAQNSRYVHLALEEFKRTLFVKKRDSHNGLIDVTHRQWATDASSMEVNPVYILQASGAVYNSEPRWKVCEGVTEESHRFVHAKSFNNVPMEPDAWPWTNLIFAFIHYVYELSNERTLISNLDCDEHGTLSNLVCYDKYTLPHHGQNSAGMAARIEMYFTRFVDQHECNEICEHLGNIRLK